VISIGDILLYVGAAAGIGVVIWLVLLLTVFNPFRSGH